MRKNDRVVVVGTTKVDLNGSEGKIVSYDEEKQRYTVELKDGKLVALREQNLQNVEAVSLSDGHIFEEVFQSFLRQAEVFRAAKPWNIIPGPWAMVCKVNSSRYSQTLERVVHVIGASDNTMRGLVVYNNIGDYNAQRVNSCLTLQYILPSQCAKEDINTYKSLGFTYKKNQPKCPNLRFPAGISSTPSDLIFLEAALPALAKFITYGHEHRNEGVELLHKVGFSFTPASLQNDFPCLQSIELNCDSSKKVTAVVKTEVMITQTAMAQARGLGTAAFENSEPSPVRPGNSAKCHACGKLRADLGAPLLKCARCMQVSYCGRDCQKAHWPQHKLDCKK